MVVVGCCESGVCGSDVVGSVEDVIAECEVSA